MASREVRKEVMEKVTSAYRSERVDRTRNGNGRGKHVFCRGSSENKYPELGIPQNSPSPTRWVSRVTLTSQHTCHQESIRVEFAVCCLCSRNIRDLTLIMTHF